MNLMEFSSHTKPTQKLRKPFSFAQRLHWKRIAFDFAQNTTKQLIYSRLLERTNEHKKLKKKNAESESNDCTS